VSGSPLSALAVKAKARGSGNRDGRMRKVVEKYPRVMEISFGPEPLGANERCCDFCVIIKLKLWSSQYSYY